MNTYLKKQLSGFIISGILATGVDYVIYNFLVYIGINLNIGKTISYLSGTVFSYLFNKYISFNMPKHSHAELMRFFTLYVASMGLNVLVNQLILFALHDAISFQFALTIAFLFATLASTIVNFLGQKFWVFVAA